MANNIFLLFTGYILHLDSFHFSDLARSKDNVLILLITNIFGFALETCRSYFPSKFAAAMCRGNLPQRLAVALPLEFATTICRGNLPQLLAVAICRGYLPWVCFVYINKSFFFVNKLLN